MTEEQNDPNLKPISHAPPTHVVKVKERNGKGGTIIGVAWQNEQGWLTVKLNPCVVLTWKDDVHIKIFPVEEHPF